AHRVHRHAAVVRLAAQPPLPAGLAEADTHVLGVGDRADRRPTFGVDAADFAGWERQLRPLGLAGGQGRAAPGGAADLAAAARLELDVVDGRPGRAPPQRQAVSD